MARTQLSPINITPNHLIILINDVHFLRRQRQQHERHRQSSTLPVPLSDPSKMVPRPTTTQRTTPTKLLVIVLRFGLFPPLHRRIDRIEPTLPSRTLQHRPGTRRKTVPRSPLCDGRVWLRYPSPCGLVCYAIFPYPKQHFKGPFLKRSVQKGGSWP